MYFSRQTVFSWPEGAGNKFFTTRKEISLVELYQLIINLFNYKALSNESHGLEEPERFINSLEFQYLTNTIETIVQTFQALIFGGY